MGQPCFTEHWHAQRRSLGTLSQAWRASLRLERPPHKALPCQRYTPPPTPIDRSEGRFQPGVLCYFAHASRPVDRRWPALSAHLSHSNTSLRSTAPRRYLRSRISGRNTSPRMTALSVAGTRKTVREERGSEPRVSSHSTTGSAGR